MYHYLIYLSYESHPLSEEDLVQILAEARTNNEASGVTGMLVYLNGKFLQLLEGRKEVIFDLYDKISKDSRHQKSTIILEEPIQKRNFENWFMGFAQISEDLLVNQTGLKDLEEFFSSGEIVLNNHPALVFLKWFYKNHKV